MPLLLQMLQALTESLPASPGDGRPAPQPPVQARTPLTGKKRSREGLEGVTDLTWGSKTLHFCLSGLLAAVQTHCPAYHATAKPNGVRPQWQNLSSPA